MLISQNGKGNEILSVCQDIRTVFKLIDVALLTGETNFQSLNKKLNYYVPTGKLYNPRKGIYAKIDYKAQELANCLGFRLQYL